MSLTPLDESDRQARADESADGDGGSKGFLARVLDRTRAFLGRVASAFRGPHVSDSPIEQHNRLESTDRETHAMKPVRGTRSESNGGGVSVTSGGRTDAPEPGDESEGPEIVATWENAGLTLSERGDDEAKISSDTWAEVER